MQIGEVWEVFFNEDRIAELEVIDDYQPVHVLAANPNKCELERLKTISQRPKEYWTQVYFRNKLTYEVVSSADFLFAEFDEQKNLFGIRDIRGVTNDNSQTGLLRRISKKIWDWL